MEVSKRSRLSNDLAQVLCPMDIQFYTLPDSRVLFNDIIEWVNQRIIGT